MTSTDGRGLVALEDQELATASLKGNRRSFELLVDRYYKVLFNVAFRMVNDLEEARDITQAAFLKGFEKLGTYDPKRKFFSWMYRILVNEALNSLARRWPQEPLDDRLLSPRQDPEQEYEARELSDAIGAGLMQLSIENREVLVLRHFLAYSYDEMSSVLGLPEKTVKSRLFSARRQLCNVLVQRGAAR
jgi:RNA polymerase sigma-70 factor (ECF subfamily)